MFNGFNNWISIILFILVNVSTSCVSNSRLIILPGFSQISTKAFCFNLFLTI